MSRIPEETIQQVIEANDIVDVISGYVPDLKRAGTSFKACCPFHNERTPSFNVSPHRQFFKCFGCGESGNVLGFVMKIENLPFVDAVKKLAKRANITIHQEVETSAQIAARKSKSRLIELHNDFAKFMHSLLLEDTKAQHARDYLKSRGFGSEMAKEWLVGYHPETPAQVIAWAKEKGYKAKELVEAGLASTSDNPSRGLYYRFRDRLMFPINNDFGDVVAFSGRQLREDPRSGKYINSPETTIFKKSKVFFGLDKARKFIPKQGYALLCEGQLDVIACHQQGFPIAIATQGTACTAEHANILKRYSKQVLLCFDSDSAGQKATEKAFVELAKVGLQVKVVTMPEGDDPDSLMQRNGAETFSKLLENAKDFFDYKVRYESTQLNLNNPSEKAELAGRLSELIASMNDNFQLQASLSFVATRLGMNEDDLRNASRIQKRKEQRVESRQNALRDSEAEAKIKPLDLHDGIATLCHISMNSPEAYLWIQEQIEPIMASSEDLSGQEVIKLILTKQPPPESPAVIMAFIESLPDIYKATLSPLYGHLNPNRTVARVDDYLIEAQQVFQKLSLESLERNRKAKSNQLANPNLTSENLITLQSEIQEITKILREYKKS